MIGSVLASHSPIVQRSACLGFRLHLRQINIFLETARNGSIKRAADALNVSQPAVSKAIKELEAALGVELFNRIPTGVTLTLFGEALLRHAAPAISELNSGLNEIESLKSSFEGTIRIGGPYVGMSRLLPVAVARIKKVHPQLNVSAIPGTNEQLLHALRIGELDLIFGRRGEPSEMAGLAFDPLFQDRLAIVVLAGHPAANRDSMELRDLVDYPWAIPLPGTQMRETLNRIFIKGDVTFPRNCFEATFGAAILTYMRQAGAIAAVASNNILDEVTAGTMKVLLCDRSWLISEAGIIRRANQPGSRFARMLIKELRQVSRATKPELLP